MKRPSSLSGSNTQHKRESLQGFCIGTGKKVPGWYCFKIMGGIPSVLWINIRDADFPTINPHKEVPLKSM